jgi:hypothetical protein
VVFLLAQPEEGQQAAAEQLLGPEVEEHGDVVIVPGQVSTVNTLRWVPEGEQLRGPLM